MDIPTLAGITAKTITTSRLATRVLFSGPEEGQPVLFLHGNLSSATWWEESMVTLPPGFRAIAPDQRGFGQADPGKKIDARRGLADLADDALALLDTLGLPRAHLVGNSLGGAVVWWLLANAPARWLSVTLVAPGSPYGFGGTKDGEGTPCWPDFAGAGAGLVNRELVRRVEAGDRSLESPFSLRAALRALVYKPPFVPAREEELLSSALSIHLGEQDWPGDVVASPNWPYVTAGIWGAANALSPRYALDPRRIYQASPKPAILWIRGSHDLAVSDSAASDPGTLGRAGFIPNWPGEGVYPPQPMLRQTRTLLERYAAAGGRFRELVIEDAGHVPFLEKPEAFQAAFHAHLQAG